MNQSANLTIAKRKITVSVTTASSNNICIPGLFVDQPCYALAASLSSILLADKTQMFKLTAADTAVNMNIRDVNNANFLSVQNSDNSLNFR